MQKSYFNDILSFRIDSKLRWSKPVRNAVKRVQRQTIAISDVIFDLRNGTDTAKQVYVDELQKVVGSNKPYAVKYQATVARHFHKMMGAIALPAGSGFVDFGSGKGRALLLASQYQFKRITGVEYDGDLCKIAEKNIKIFFQQKNIDADVRIIHCDATKYEIQDDDNIFFFSNPFGPQVMQPILDRIVASVRQKPRKAWLIYYSVPTKNVIAACNAFTAIAKFNFSQGWLWELHGPGRDSIVYKCTIAP